MFFSSFAYFSDVFNSSIWTDLRAAVPQGDDVLFSLSDSLPDMALASRAPLLHPSIPLPSTDENLGRVIMA